MPVYRRGGRDPAVAVVREVLGRLGFPAAAVADSDVFDGPLDSAVRAFQQARGLGVDGLIGPETFRALEEARWQLGDRLLSYRATHPYVGDDVAQLQHRLLDMGYDPGRSDGIFGPRTEAALREFQRDMGVDADGTVGPRTLKLLDRLARTVVGGSPEQMREEVRFGLPGATLSGRLIIIDPAHGGADRGVTAGGLEEAAIVEDLAARVEGRLGAIGLSAYLTHGPDSCPAEEERAAFANEAGGDLFLSLHVEAAEDQKCNGVATYYYGHPTGDRGTGSALGRRLASLVQREIVARTDLLDCRTHPKTWALLRNTRMPAVRIDLGYLTNAADAGRLASSEFRDAVADAVVAAVQRLYLPPERDVATGQLPIPVLM